MSLKTALLTWQDNIESGRSAAFSAEPTVLLSLRVLRLLQKKTVQLLALAEGADTLELKVLGPQGESGLLFECLGKRR